jgi:hypothetical protein
MQLADGMMADMHSADVALMYARDYAAPTGGCLTVEQVYQAPSFVTLRIAEKLMRIRKTVGFVPADQPLRFNL